MPRVSPEHLQARRDQILDAARRCFVRNGFHATSMQDVFAEAGLSAGATYRYFRSKEEIVEAIAAQMLERMGKVFDSVVTADPVPPLDQAFRVLFEEFVRLDEEFELAKIVVQVWGEAVRSPGMRDAVQGLFGVIRARATRLVRIYQERGEMGPADAETVGRAFIGCVPGFILQRAIFGDVDPASYAEGLRSLLGRGKVTSG